MIFSCRCQDKSVIAKANTRHMKDNGGKLVKEKCIMTKRPNGRILIDWEEEEEEEESEEEESEEVR